VYDVYLVHIIFDIICTIYDLF